MIRHLRFRTPDDERAHRLARYVDALNSNSDTTPVPAADIADLATIARALVEASPDPAPAHVHAKARAFLNVNPEWRTLVTAEPYDAAAHPPTPNGHRPSVPMRPAPTSEAIPTPLRRLSPLIELAAIAAVLSLLFYVVYQNYQTADEPTPTVPPPPVLTPTPPAITPTSAPGAVGDWPMLGGGPSRSAGVDRIIPTAAPTLKWSTALPGGIRSPIAAGDAIYVSNGGVIVAVDAATGTERWRFDLGVAPSVAGANPPAVVGGLLFAGAHDGTVFAVDVATGQAVWSYETNGTITTGVAVAEGVVYVGTTDGSLHAVDAISGAKRWSYPTGPISISSPVIADGVVYVGAGGNQLVAIDAATGALRWQQAVKPGMQSVAVGAGIVVAAGINTSSSVLLIAVDANKGTTRWQGRLPVDLPPAIVDDTVYVVSGSVIAAFGADRGAQHWSFEAKLKIVDLAVVGPTLIAHRKDGTVFAIDRNTGKELWRIKTGDAATGIAVGAGVLYVAQNNGTITAYG